MGYSRVDNTVLIDGGMSAKLLRRQKFTKATVQFVITIYHSLYQPQSRTPTIHQDDSTREIVKQVCVLVAFLTSKSNPAHQPTRGISKKKKRGKFCKSRRHYVNTKKVGQNTRGYDNAVHCLNRRSGPDPPSSLICLRLEVVW